MKFHTIEELVDEVRKGHLVVMADDESRENEGDLILAAQFVTPEKINFMMREGRGLICVPLPDERLFRLGLRDMVTRSEDPMRTAFTVSVDASLGITTGVSAYDRARTIEVLADLKSKPADLTTPGHVFPLRAKTGGVLIRAGHTEAAVDLARLAGLTPAGVICEIVNDDGTMARVPQLFEFACSQGIKIGTIQSLIEYRRRFDKLVEKVAEADLPTETGLWSMKVYRSRIDGKEHVALVKGELSEAPTMVRVHSECFTSEVFGSLRCDCREQIISAMSMIEQEKKGVLLYIRQEGRGIGLVNKLKAYRLQDQGLDTVEANEELGFKPDLREYGTGAQILKDLGLFEIRLLTNNPRKIVGLEGHGLKVIERIQLEIRAHAYNKKYLQAKQEKMGHLLTHLGHH
ncbi:MAG: bifunctional 3,4-dihydroxy-2-butanone 4-phosphate synthase/GTP cyclohydrolase II [Omnitrophica bacterium RIFCSPLOWO2_12_FULL_50_11]|nr:MAG: bifunctional 3,4-dihydroxy-2-butanone 4-phosphate synthase/GTP cyclohydrolase II [Omnitrophica bacterium RIFCSPLOWO2_12_FULL_50_11]